MKDLSPLELQYARQLAGLINSFFRNTIMSNTGYANPYIQLVALEMVVSSELGDISARINVQDATFDVNHDLQPLLDEFLHLVRNESLAHFSEVMPSYRALTQVQSDTQESSSEPDESDYEEDDEAPRQPTPRPKG